jgi:hypothetical protein
MEGTHCLRRPIRAVITQGKRACPVCGALFPTSSEACPVCALHGAINPESRSSINDTHSDSNLRFEHYVVLANADGTPIELGHGAMGVTYRALDINLRCVVALKVINARFIGASNLQQKSACSVLRIVSFYIDRLRIRFQNAPVDRDVPKSQRLSVVY